MKLISQISLIAVLAGCSAQTQQGIEHAMSTYNGVQVQNVRILGEGWRIFDRPDLGIMMITTSFENAIENGAREGVTFQLAKNQWINEEEFRPAAKAYIENKGCNIGEGRFVLRLQYEFSYTC